MGTTTSTTSTKRCMYRNCQKHAVPFFAIAKGVRVAYVPAPTALLRSLDVVKWLKSHYTENKPVVFVQLCKKHSAMFFKQLLHAATAKYGQQAVNFIMKRLVYTPMAAQLGMSGADAADFWKASEQGIIAGGKRIKR